MRLVEKDLGCLSLENKKKLIGQVNGISIRRQCELLNLSPNNLYYKPKTLSANEQLILNKVDEIYTEHPYYGSRRMQEELLELEVAVCRQKYIVICSDFIEYI